MTAADCLCHRHASLNMPMVGIEHRVDQAARLIFAETHHVVVCSAMVIAKKGLHRLPHLPLGLKLVTIPSHGSLLHQQMRHAAVCPHWFAQLVKSFYAPAANMASGRKNWARHAIRHVYNGGHGGVRAHSSPNLRREATRMAEELLSDNNWAIKLAIEIADMSITDAAEVIEAKALDKPWKYFPKLRRCGSINLSARELWLLSNKIHENTLPEPNTGCLLWTAGADWDGYGATGFTGKQVKAHRAAYILEYGDIPSGMAVCHSCDTPSCCNPAHLSLGTNQENIRQMISRKRNVFGERVGTSKYTPVFVSEIKNLRRSGMSAQKIAALKNIPQSTVEGMVYGPKKSWTHLEEC